MPGIEQTKKAVTTVLSFTKELTQLKKANFFTMLGLLNEIGDLVDMVKNRQLVLAELRDLSPEERKELVDHVALEFDIPDDKLEERIEKSLDFAESFVTLIEMWK